MLAIAWCLLTLFSQVPEFTVFVRNIVLLYERADLFLQILHFISARRKLSIWEGVGPLLFFLAGRVHLNGWALPGLYERVDVGA